MSALNLCRLCVNLCKDYKSLYDASGERNEVYNITVKFFHPMFLNVEQDSSQMTVMCLECWQNIFVFHNFQESVLLAQSQLLEDEKQCSQGLRKNQADVSQEISGITFNGKPNENSQLEPDAVDLPNLELVETLYPSIKSESFCSLVSSGTNIDTVRPSNSKDSNTDEIIKISDEEILSTDEEYDDPIGYFTGGSFNEAAELETIKVECPSSEDETLFLLEDDEDEKTDNEMVENLKPSILTESPLKNRVTETEVNDQPRQLQPLQKRKRKSLRELDAAIAEWKPNLECAICHTAYPSFSQLQAHYVMQHPQEKCHIICCNKRWDQRFTIERHIRFHRKEEKFETQTTQKTTRELDEFIAHCEPQLRCFLCGEERTNFGQLNEHFRECHPQKRCYVICCGRYLARRYDIAEHILVHLDQTLFHCALCQKFNISKDGLKNHLLVRHNMAMADLPPASAAALENKLCAHIKVKNIDSFIAQYRPQLGCLLCSESCGSFTSLQAHFWEKHPQEPECYIKCCERKLFTRHQLEEHLLLHNDPMAFKCQHCDECFINRASLYCHGRLKHPLTGRSRTNQVAPRKSLETIDALIAQWRPELPCDLCQESCQTFAQLKLHFRQQHPQREFYIVCCQRKFHERTPFLKHNKQVHVDNACERRKRTSTKELDRFIAQWIPNVECSVCQATFSTFTLLKEHFRQQHPNVVYHIVCCQRKLTLRNSIQRHLRHCHKRSEPPPDMLPGRTA